jgi:hypothetical protein
VHAFGPDLGRWETHEPLEGLPARPTLVLVDWRRFIHLGTALRCPSPPPNLANRAIARASPIVARPYIHAFAVPGSVMIRIAARTIAAMTPFASGRIGTAISIIHAGVQYVTISRIVATSFEIVDRSVHKVPSTGRIACRSCHTGDSASPRHLCFLAAASERSQKALPH